MVKLNKQGESIGVVINKGDRRHRQVLRSCFSSFVKGDFLCANQNNTVKKYIDQCKIEDHQIPSKVSISLINKNLNTLRDSFGFPSIDEVENITLLKNVPFSTLLATYDIKTLKEGPFLERVTSGSYSLNKINERLLIEEFPEHYLRVCYSGNINKYEGLIFLQKDIKSNQIMILEGHHRMFNGILRETRNRRKSIKVSGWILQFKDLDKYIFSSLNN